MKCLNCGHVNSESGKFCEKCGKALVSSEVNKAPKSNPLKITGIKLDKILTISFFCINVFLIFAFFLVSWINLNVASIGVGGSVFRIILLISSASKIINEGYQVLYMTYFLLAIPLLAGWSIACLFLKDVSIDQFYHWSKVTFVTTISLIVILFLSKYIFIQYSNLAYIGGYFMTFGFGCIMSLILSIIGLLLPRFLPKILNEGISINIDDVKGNLASKFENMSETNTQIQKEQSEIKPLIHQEIEISLEDGELMLQDLNSAHAIYLNEDLIESINIYGLLDGDIIKMNQTSICIRILGDELEENSEVPKDMNTFNDETMMLGSEE